MRNNNSNRRSAVRIMGQLIGLVIPLLHVMLSAIILGVAGYLCAISLTILASEGIYRGISKESVGTILLVLPILAVMRGVLHYAEQYCNHFIAFKLLAIIRHKVFAALRKLCPAKLEGKDKGNLISIITSDIELLEVFYAHTISPIAIAFIVSVIMVCFIGRFHICLGICAAFGYLSVGVVIPILNGKRGAGVGMKYRNEFGELNSFVLESLRGLDETMQYGRQKEREEQLLSKSANLGGFQKKLSNLEGTQRAVTNMIILIFSFGMLFISLYLYMNGTIDFEAVLLSTVAMMGSFGPVVALSSLSNNLNQTLASGERVLSLLEESPQVEEVENQKNVIFTGAKLENVSFGYEESEAGHKDNTILNNYNIEIPQGKILGIHGASGTGKSTILKLLMRFWDTDKGNVKVSDHNVKEINTSNLRDMESYVTQETHIFHDTIANNIAIGKTDATKEEIIDAAKKASIHDFIMSLPSGYETKVGELGDTLSGGERQRIGIARAFLHDAPFLLLDEPTSNLDSLNEGIILKSLKDTSQNRTIVLVSHRKSTMNLADLVFEME